MKPLKVFIDMDGVLTNFLKACAPLFDTTEEELMFELYEQQTYSLPQVLDISLEQFTDVIDMQGVAFWEDMEEYPWADRLLNSVGANHKVYIASDPSYFEYSAIGKLRWLRRKTGGRKFSNYSFTPYKHLLANPHSLLIDDNLNNLSEFVRKGGEAVRFPQPWNTKKEDDYGKLNIVERITKQVDDYAKGVRVKQNRPG